MMLGRAIVLLVSIALVASACKKPDPPGEGFLLVTISVVPLQGTPLETLQRVTLANCRVDVVHRSNCDDPSTETVLRDVGDIGEVSIDTTMPLVGQIVARMPIPIGCVMQVRFIVESASLTMDGITEPVRVPSGPQSGLKVVPEEGEPPFPIRNKDTTAIRVDYDPNQKLVFTGGDGIHQKPVLEAHEVDRDNAVGIVLDEIVLTFESGTTQQKIEDIVADFPATIIRQWPREFVTVKLPDTDSMVNAVAFFRGKDKIKTALPNFLLDASNHGPNPHLGAVSDDFWDDPLGNSANEGYERTMLESVFAPEAWAHTTGEPDVIIAVVDTGFEMQHADLLDNIWINQAEIPTSVSSNANCDVDGDGRITFRDLNSTTDTSCCPAGNADPVTICDPLDLVDGDCSLVDGDVYECTAGYGWQNGVDEDGNGFDDDLFGWDFKDGDNLPAADDGVFHGTAVAAQAAGVGNNGIAGLGVAWNASVMLIRSQVRLTGSADPLKIDRDTAIRGLRYAYTTPGPSSTEDGPSVINMSIGTMLTEEGTSDFTQECLERQEAGVAEIPSDKFTDGIQELVREWNEELPASLRSQALLVFAAKNCGVDVDISSRILYPGGFAVNRSDLGIGTVHPEMVVVGNVRTIDPISTTPSMLNQPREVISDDVASFGTTTIQITAPGEGWRVLSVRLGAEPTNVLSQAITFCDPTVAVPDYFGRCFGASFSAPLVSGAAALVLAADPTLHGDGAALKDRILRNGCEFPLFIPGFENGRFLNVENAVNDVANCPGTL